MFHRYVSLPGGTNHYYPTKSKSFHHVPSSTILPSPHRDGAADQGHKGDAGETLHPILHAVASTTGFASAAGLFLSAKFRYR